MGLMTMKRGDIYWVNLDPTHGVEIKGIKKMRPCVVVSVHPINLARYTVVVVPLSTSAKARPPLVVAVKCLAKTVVAVCDQIRAVDKTRLVKKAGQLSEENLGVLDDGLRCVLAL
jgi:mRNA interferase MazF